MSASTEHDAGKQIDAGATWPERSRGAVAATLVGAVITGPLVGFTLAALLAPGSALAIAAGVFSFPIALALGYRIWQVRVAAVFVKGIVRGALGALWSLLVKRRRPALRDVLPDRERLEKMVGAAARAASAFAHVGWLVGCVAGLALAFVAESSPGLAFAVTLLAHAVAGHALTRLARAGYLPPPDGA